MIQRNSKEKEEKTLKETSLMNKGKLHAYTTPGSPIAFSRLSQVQRYYGNQMSQHDVQRALETYPVFVLHRKKTKQKTTNPYFIYFKRQQVQVDHIDMTQLAQANNLVKYLCVAIDAFTKKAAIVPQKKKTGTETLKSLEKFFFHLLPPPPQNVLFDEGKEFNNKIIKSFLTNIGVNMSNPLSSLHKAAIAERFNQTFQRLIYQYLTHNNTKTYINVLPLLLRTYNTREHNAIKMSPEEGEKKENHYLIRQRMEEKLHKFFKGKRKRKLTIKKGDIVLIRAWKKDFARGYHQSFKNEPFLVRDLNIRLPIPMYTLQSISKGDIIRGNFYESELQKYYPAP